MIPIDRNADQIPEIQTKFQKNILIQEKSRCSPRTRMHSRRTVLWNKLFEQSCTFFPCYRTTRLWNAEEGEVQRVECGMYSVKSVVWSVECGV